jgi:hypothetical protein
MIISQNIKWLILFSVNLLVVALALWIVGRSTVGKKKAKFTDALWIALLGLILGSLFTKFMPLLGFLIALVLWLALIHHFFDTGWLGALGIAIIALIIYVILSWFILFLFNLSLWSFPKLFHI